MRALRPRLSARTGPLLALLATLTLAGAVAGGPAEDAAKLFSLTCAPCHGKDGKAQTPMGIKLGAKDLAQSHATASESERRIREGARSKTGATLMPAYQNRLTPQQIEGLVAHVQSLRKSP